MRFPSFPDFRLPVLLAPAVLLAGCLDFEEHFTLHADGTVSATHEMHVPATTVAMMGEEGTYQKLCVDPWDERSLQQSGDFTVMEPDEALAFRDMGMTLQPPLAPRYEGGISCRWRSGPMHYSDLKPSTLDALNLTLAPAPAGLAVSSSRYPDANPDEMLRKLGDCDLMPEEERPGPSELCDETMVHFAIAARGGDADAKQALGVFAQTLTVGVQRMLEEVTYRITFSGGIIPGEGLAPYQVDTADAGALPADAQVFSGPALAFMAISPIFTVPQR